LGSRKERAVSVKKGRKSQIIKMLFSYLAISKIFYWYNTIVHVINHGDLSGMGDVVLNRLLSHDMIIILGVFLIFFMEEFLEVHFETKKLGKVLEQILLHLIAYVIFMVAFSLYVLVVHLAWGTFQDIAWGRGLFYSSLGYIVTVTVLDVKKYFKTKAMTRHTPPALDTEDALAALKTLLDNNVLTQEEYDRKKEKLLGT